MSSYQPLQLQRAPRITPPLSKEAKYWTSFTQREPALSQFGIVSGVAFAPGEQDLLAVASYDTVVVYHPTTYESLYSIPYAGHLGCNSIAFRADGRLLVTGDGKGVVRVWDASRSSGLTRELRHGHKGPVHKAWFTSDNVHVVSCSDDRTAAIWDLATATKLASVEGHSDYIRAGAGHPSNDALFVTGSYDRTVKLWDWRSSHDKAVISIGLSEAVGAVAFHPSGVFLATASGHDVIVWDLMRSTTSLASPDSVEQLAETSEPVGTETPSQTFKQVFEFSTHQKAVTTLAFSADSRYLVSGSVDTFAKVYNTKTYQVSRSFSFSTGVTAAAFNADATCCAFGLQSGKTEIFSHNPVEKSALASIRGAIPRPLTEEEKLIEEFFAPEKARVGDALLSKRRNAVLEKYDKMLKAFRYHDALDAVLAVESENKNIVVLVLLDELYRRNGLRIALHGRTAAQLLPILDVAEQMFSLSPLCVSTFTAVVEILLEIYHPVLHQSNTLLATLQLLQRRLQQYITDLCAMQTLYGTVDCLLKASAAQTERTKVVSHTTVDTLLTETSRDAHNANGEAKPSVREKRSRAGQSRK